MTFARRFGVVGSAGVGVVAAPVPILAVVLALVAGATFRSSLAHRGRLSHDRFVEQFINAAVWVVGLVGALVLLAAGMAKVLLESTFGASGYVGIFLLALAFVLMGLLGWAWKRLFPDNWPH